MEPDFELDAMLLLAYRLSWPQPKRCESPAHRLARLARHALTPERMEGWPVLLSAPGRA